MKIPKTVKIAGYEFKVKYPWKQKNQSWAAEIDHDQQIIRISNKRPDGKKKAVAGINETFLHELIHGVNRLYLSNRRQLKEDQVEQISEGIFQVLKDNKLRF